MEGAALAVAPRCQASLRHPVMAPPEAEVATGLPEEAEWDSQTAWSGRRTR